MSKAPKIDPSAWASQRDAKIQRANELRELRKRENQNQNQNQQHTNQPAAQPSSPRNLAPPSDGWVGGAMGGAPAGGGRYNKATRGGFTFAQQTPQPSTGDENEVRQQLWEMKEAAQQQRRSVSGVGYSQGGGGASTDSPVRQHGNYGADWNNPQNPPPNTNVASSWAGGFNQPAPIEPLGTRPPWLQNTPPRSSNEAYGVGNAAVNGTEGYPPTNHYPGNGGYGSQDPHYPTNQYQPQQQYYQGGYQQPPMQQGYPPQQPQQQHYPPSQNHGSRSPRADGMTSSPLRSRPSPGSPSRRSTNENGSGYPMKVRTPREKHNPNNNAPYSPIVGDTAALLSSDDIAQQRHEEQLRELQRQQDALQEQQRRNLEQQKLLQQQQEEHQRKLKIKQQQKFQLEQQQKLQKQKEAEIKMKAEQEAKRVADLEKAHQESLKAQAASQIKTSGDGSEVSGQQAKSSPSSSSSGHRSSHRSKAASKPPRNCLFSFTAEHKSELTVESGEPLRVLGETTNNGWVLVERVNATPKANGKRPKGYIPMSYLGDELVIPSEPSPTLLVNEKKVSTNDSSFQETKLTQTQKPVTSNTVAMNTLVGSPTPLQDTKSLSQGATLVNQTLSVAAAVVGSPQRSSTVGAATLLPATTFPVVEDDFLVNDSVPAHGQVNALDVVVENQEVDIFLRASVDPSRDVGGGWADDFADAANPLDLAPRPLPKINRKVKAKDKVKKSIPSTNNISPSRGSSSPSHAVDVHADGSVAIRPQRKEKSGGDGEVKRPHKNESSKSPSTPNQPISPKRHEPSSSGSKKDKAGANVEDDESSNKVEDANDSSASQSPRNSPSRRSRRSKSGKPPPPPPPPEEPPPPQKWDWEDIPIVSKASQQLRESEKQQTIPSLTKEGKSSSSNASWLEQPYGQPDSARRPSSGIVGGEVSPRLSPRPHKLNPVLSPRVTGAGGGGAAPGSLSNKLGGRRPRSAEMKGESSTPEAGPSKDGNEYGMNAMLRELHHQRRSRRESGGGEQQDVSNMRTMAVDVDSNDVENGGWQDNRADRAGYEGNKPVKGRHRPGSSDDAHQNSNELIMNHSNHHLKPEALGKKANVAVVQAGRRPSPWRSEEPPSQQTIAATTIQSITPRSPRLGGNNKVRPFSDGSSSPRVSNTKAGDNQNLQRMLHDAKQGNNRKDHGSAGGLGIDHSAVGAIGGNFDNEAERKKRRKKPAPTPASGAVPLNVKNARRNAGDGDDHFPEDGSVVGGGGDIVKKGRGDGTRQNFDKRTSRMKNARHFKGAIAGYRELKMKLFENPNGASSYEENDHDDSEEEGDMHQGGDGLVKVFVRKRPLFEYEAARGEFDVVSILNQKYQRQNPDGSNSGYRGCKVLIHNCMMHPDMKRMYHKACWFPAHHAFGEMASNPGVFTKCALPLVKAVSDGKGVGTLFMYGQTGSGKTHTMTGIEEGVAMSLSALLHGEDNSSDGTHKLSSDSVSVRLRFFELVGKRCVDLIAQKAGAELKLMNDGNDAVRPAGAAEPVVNDASHLLALLKLGKKRRATAPTDVNGGSSRSHAVCQIVVDRFGTKATGLLTLVDCAGSERKEDSMYHDKERQKESTEINASLYALKECVRARALAAKGKNVQIPFRSSSLTKVLMESFVRSDAHLAVIATVSPIPTDTEHSISTLRTVCAIAGYNDSDMVEEKQEVKPNLPKREERVPPIKWTAAQLLGWVKSVSNGRFAEVANDLPRGTTGKVVMRWGAAQFSAICGGPAVGGALQRLLQEERARCDQLEQLKRQDRLG